MKKHTPFVHAFAAALYIVFIVSLLSTFVDGNIKPRFVLLLPMTMLGLLTLSASIMAYLFGYEPLSLYLDGKKQEALAFFSKTVGCFAGFALLFFVALFLSAQ